MLSVIILLSLVLLISLLYKRNYERFNLTNDNRKAELMFIHIPKNAGTSIEVAAKKYGIMWGLYYDFKKHGINRKNENINVSVWHIPPKILKNNKGYEVYFKKKVPFCVVRNPYERAVSEYKYHNNLYKIPISKQGLNEFITTIESRLNRDICDFGCHFIPQSEYIYGYNNNKVSEILRFENLETDFKKLCLKYNYPNIKLEKINKTGKVVTINDLNSESIKTINKIYKKDFINFNYEMK